MGSLHLKRNSLKDAKRLKSWRRDEKAKNQNKIRGKNQGETEMDAEGGEGKSLNPSVSIRVEKENIFSFTR